MRQKNVRVRPGSLRVIALMSGLIALSAAVDARAGDEACREAAADTDRTHLSDVEEQALLAAGHPNERYRLMGAKSAAGGHWPHAWESFRRAARFADKYSQHRISMLYWHGCGVDRDPSAAYAWADLAAERLYPDFVVLRERIWNALDETQRARAIEIGREVYAEYGDAVAKPRFAVALGQAKRNTTGSRTGFQNRLSVSGKPIGGDPRELALPLTSGTPVTKLGDLYRAKRWTAETYWAREDARWRMSNVTIGPIDTNGERKTNEAAKKPAASPATEPPARNEIKPPAMQ